MQSVLGLDGFGGGNDSRTTEVPLCVASSGQVLARVSALVLLSRAQSSISDGGDFLARCARDCREAVMRSTEAEEAFRQWSHLSSGSGSGLAGHARNNVKPILAEMAPLAEAAGCCLSYPEIAGFCLPEVALAAAEMLFSSRCSREAVVCSRRGVESSARAGASEC